MNRSGPLKRRTPLKPRAPMSRTGKPAREPAQPKRAQLRAVSPKTAPKRRNRAQLVARLVAAGVCCEVCPELARHGIHTGCTGTIGGLHERRKRSSAGSTTNPVNLIPACNPGNDAIETNVDVMRAADGWLIVRPGHPDWDRTAARNDRHNPPPAVTVNHCQWCGMAYVTIPPSRLLTCGHAAIIPVPDPVKTHEP